MARPSRYGTPRDKSLLIFDLASDVHELDPLSVSSENDRFSEETTAQELWFKATDLTEADMKRAKRDEEILKSLGTQH